MPRACILRSSPIVRTPRVMQIEGMFDVPPVARSEQRWDIDFELPLDWNVGVIVGPSGSGKSTCARELFGAHLAPPFTWSPDKSLLDDFPATLPVKELVLLLSSVGFSSPPSWLRPFHVLSTGEQFRVSLARSLCEQRECCVIDEFTSVVDRTVAQIGSAALAKTVRRRAQKFIAVTCHYDVLEWLAPDWVFQPHLNQFDLPRGSLRRPPLDLEIRRVDRAAWHLFKPHHYLSADLHKAAVCFVAFLHGRPAAFDAWLSFFGQCGGRSAKRGHRTVCLPDFQGVGIGNRLFTHVARAWRALGYRAFSKTGHPAEIAARQRSPDWRCLKLPGFGHPDHRTRARSTTRLTASFEFVGEPMPLAEAIALTGCNPV